MVDFEPLKFLITVASLGTKQKVSVVPTLEELRLQSADEYNPVKRSYMLLYVAKINRRVWRHLSHAHGYDGWRGLQVFMVHGKGLISKNDGWGFDIPGPWD